jgi:hypothetical protein
LADLSSQPTPVQTIYNWYRDGALYVNRKYQRKLVWTLIEKQKLIDSILRGYPIPLVLLAERRDRGPWSRTRIDHTSLGFRGRFCPIRRPLFQGSRRGTDGWLLSSMIVSSEPTAPSRLRSDQGRRGILCLGAGLLLKPTRSSSAASGSTP